MEKANVSKRFTYQILYHMNKAKIKNNLVIKPFYKVYKIITGKFNKQTISVPFPDFSIKRNDIFEVSKEFNNVQIFVETGTFFGDTIEYFKNNFMKLYSIELSLELADKAKKRFQNDTKISIIHGDSSRQLSNILREINTPCLFWLDGHYSSEFWIGKEYIKTAKGNKDTPILAELSQIIKHEIKSHVILIDDARLFIGKNDYPSIKRMQKFVSKNLPSHSFEVKNDIIRILPNQN